VRQRRCRDGDLACHLGTDAERTGADRNALGPSVDGQLDEVAKWFVETDFGWRRSRNISRSSVRDLTGPERLRSTRRQNVDRTRSIGDDGSSIRREDDSPCSAIDVVSPQDRQRRAVDHRDLGIFGRVNCAVSPLSAPDDERLAVWTQGQAVSPGEVHPLPEPPHAVTSAVRATTKNPRNQRAAEYALRNTFGLSAGSRSAWAPADEAGN